jgi:hypothetical protein
MSKEKYTCEDEATKGWYELEPIDSSIEKEAEERLKTLDESKLVSHEEMFAEVADA